MLFSQRIGINPVRNVIQINSMDDTLRNRLWNNLTLYYWGKIRDDYFELFAGFFKLLWLEYFKEPIDTMPLLFNAISLVAHSRKTTSIYREIRSYFFECNWYSVYDFVEFVAMHYPSTDMNREFIDVCNHVLEDELSAYRFINGKIAQITSELEIAEVEEAITDNSIPRAVSAHLGAALKSFAESRTNPSVDNFRNSMKESISAVEAMCQSISGTTRTLDKTLDEIEKRTEVKIHRSLKEAFSKLYGYTNDAEGIRHAMKDEPTVDFEDAKLMLVSCSSFINYLKVKSTRAKATK